MAKPYEKKMNINLSPVRATQYLRYILSCCLIMILQPLIN